MPVHSGWSPSSRESHCPLFWPALTAWSVNTTDSERDKFSSLFKCQKISLDVVGCSFSFNKKLFLSPAQKKEKEKWTGIHSLLWHNSEIFHSTWFPRNLFFCLLKCVSRSCCVSQICSVPNRHFFVDRLKGKSCEIPWSFPNPGNCNEGVARLQSIESFVDLCMDSVLLQGATMTLNAPCIPLLFRIVEGSWGSHTFFSPCFASQKQNSNFKILFSVLHLMHWCWCNIIGRLNN